MLWEMSWLRKILCLFLLQEQSYVAFNHTWAMKKGPLLFTRLFFGDENPTQFLLGSFHKPLFRSVVINQTTNQYFSISMESTVNWIHRNSAVPVQKTYWFENFQHPFTIPYLPKVSSPAIYLGVSKNNAIPKKNGFAVTCPVDPSC